MSGRNNSLKYSLVNIFKILLVLLVVFLIASCPDPMSDDLLAEVEDVVGPVITITSPDPSDLVNLPYYFATIDIVGNVKDFSNDSQTILGSVQSISYSELFNPRVSGIITPNADGDFTVLIDAVSPIQLEGAQSIVITAIDWNGNLTPSTVTFYEKNSGPVIIIYNRDTSEERVYSSSLSDDILITGIVGLPADSLTFAVDASLGTDISPTSVSYDLATGDYSYSFDPGLPLNMSGQLTILMEGTAFSKTSTKILYLTDDPTAPDDSSSSLATDNTSISVTLNEAVYSTTGGTGVLDISDFNLSFNQNTGDATNTVITGFSTTPLEGDTSFQLNVTVTGTPDGSETVTLSAAANSIYDRVGNISNFTTGAITLNDEKSPTVVSVTQTDARHLVVVFSEEVNSGQAETFAYYSNPDTPANPATDSSLTGGNTVTLTFGSDINSGVGLDITDGVINDLDNNAYSGVTEDILDGVQPTITSITTSSGSGPFNDSENIDITVNFDEPVTLVGTATLAFNSIATTATLTNPPRSSSFLFTYNIEDGDLSSDLTVDSFTWDNDPVDDSGNVLIGTILGAGNFWNSINLAIDAVDPVVSIQTGSPLYLKIGGGSIAATIVEAGSGIDTREWSGSGVVTFADSTAEDPTVTDADEGSQTLTLTVTDLAGNIGTNTIQLIWDESLPYITSMGSDLILNASGGSINATAGDAVSGIISWAWTSSPAGVVFGTPSTEDTTITGSGADGTYILTLEVTDNAGNVFSDTINMIWDETLPTVNLVSPINIGQSTTLSTFDDTNQLNVVDSGGITDNIEIATYEWAGVDVFFDDADNTDLDVIVDVLGDVETSYTVTLTVTDTAGNVETDDMVLNWDSGPEITSIVFADDGTNPGVGENDTITFTFDEAIDKGTVGFGGSNTITGTLAALILEVGYFGVDGDIVTDSTSDMVYSNSSPYTLIITLGPVSSGATPPSGNFNADDDIEDTSGNLIHNSNAVIPESTFDLTASFGSYSTITGSITIDITVIFSEPINTGSFAVGTNLILDNALSDATITSTPAPVPWTDGDKKYTERYTITTGTDGTFEVTATLAEDLYGNIQNTDASVVITIDVP